ncbi:hypothetical protein QJS10_CPA09g01514 [Acorus calamus]|uniref:Uncharacterized protein n=1 Tax=Acorus calamus TaxID=4465 RepID=A0AAV9E5H5_ACOCL|nr:hypothetical protein QJS10_CPA09g01514 [Acorus calamus]
MKQIMKGWRKSQMSSTKPTSKGCLGLIYFAMTEQACRVLFKATRKVHPSVVI